jgi:hypothetical protein
LKPDRHKRPNRESGPLAFQATQRWSKISSGIPKFSWILRIILNESARLRFIQHFKQSPKGVVALDAVLATSKTKRQEVVDIFNALLGDKESVIVSVAKVIELSRLDKKTFHKHLKDIREKEFVLTSKGYGTEIKRR